MPPVGFEPTTNGLKVHCANQAAPQGQREAIGPGPRSGRTLPSNRRIAALSEAVRVHLARWRVMARRSVIGLVLVAAAVVPSCGQIPEPEGFTVAVSTSQAALDAAPEEDAVPVAGLGITPTSAEFVPRAPDDYEPEVLVATSGAVLASSPEGLRPLAGPLAEQGTTRVVDDLLGGVVVQESAVGADKAGPVVWLAAQGAEPAVIDSKGARLLDVGYVDGSPSAVVLRAGGQVERIRLVDLATTPMVTLDPNEDLLALSASGGLHAVAVANDRCGDLRFYSADGEQLVLNGPGEPDCIVPRRPAYGEVALSPDGQAVAYTVPTYRDDGIVVATELVIRDLTSGQESMRRKIGQDGDLIVALSFDGERAVFLRQSGSVSSVALLGLTGDRVETLLALPDGANVSSVSFARLRLASG